MGPFRYLDTRFPLPPFAAEAWSSSCLLYGVSHLEADMVSLAEILIYIGRKLLCQEKYPGGC
jgi:hypothetical protein